jgi:hypothetical protein
MESLCSGVYAPKNMTENIVQYKPQSTESPFDSIRRFDADGNEYWMARELMPLLGYLKWQRFCEAIERAKITCQLNNEPEASHINHLPGSVNMSGHCGDDYRLSRNACYWIAMAGDVRKPEIAQAHQYFAIKTREAEVIVPAMSEKLELAKIENDSLRMMLEIEKLKDKALLIEDARLKMHGLEATLVLAGKGDAIVQVDRVIESTIDPRSNSTYDGQSLVLVKDQLKKKCGLKYASN